MKLADNLWNMGFRPCQAYSDLWLRPWMYHYEAIAVITDGLLLFTNNPADILEPLRKAFGYEIKGFGTPEYYNRVDVGYDKGKKKCFLDQRLSSKSLLRKLRN